MASSNHRLLLLTSLHVSWVVVLTWAVWPISVGSCVWSADLSGLLCLWSAAGCRLTGLAGMASVGVTLLSSPWSCILQPASLGLLAWWSEASPNVSGSVKGHCLAKSITHTIGQSKSQPALTQRVANRLSLLMGRAAKPHTRGTGTGRGEFQ